jgi:hypothetical protein
MDITVIMMISLLLAQIGQCFMGSRCTKINTPCLSLERDVKLSPEEMAGRTFSTPPVNDNRPAR